MWKWKYVLPFVLFAVSALAVSYIYYHLAMLLGFYNPILYPMARFSGPLTWPSFQVKVVDVQSGEPIKGALISLMWSAKGVKDGHTTGSTVLRSAQETDDEGITTFSRLVKNEPNLIEAQYISGDIFHIGYNKGKFTVSDFKEKIRRKGISWGIRRTYWTSENGVITLYLEPRKYSIQYNDVKVLFTKGPFVYAGTGIFDPRYEPAVNWSRFDTQTETWQLKSDPPPGWINSRTDQVLEKAYEPDGTYWEALDQNWKNNSTPDGWYSKLEPFQGIKVPCLIHMGKDGLPIKSLSLYGILYYEPRHDIAVTKDDVWLNAGLLARIDKKTMLVARYEQGEIFDGYLNTLATHGDYLFIGTTNQGITRYHTKTGKKDLYHY